MKPEPFSVTVVPGEAVSGENDVIEGSPANDVVTEGEVPVHPLESVTVTVYVPAVAMDVDCVVDALLH